MRIAFAIAVFCTIGCASRSSREAFCVPATGQGYSHAVYDQNGNYLNAFGGSDMFDRLSYVEVDASGERVSSAKKSL